MDRLYDMVMGKRGITIAFRFPWKRQESVHRTALPLRQSSPVSVLLAAGLAAVVLLTGSLRPVRLMDTAGAAGTIGEAAGTAGEQTDAPPVVLDHDTNTNACYYLSEIEEELRAQYPQLYRCIADRREGRPNAYVIPGMIQTATLRADDQTPGVSTAMDPQGLAVTDHYLVISAYSKDLAYNSVLYVLDRADGSYVKTIVLPGTPHAGGIAYDPVAKRLWIADSRGPKSRLCALDQQTLERTDFARDQKAVVYDAVVPIDEPADAAFLAYREDHLYVGSFERMGGGIMVRYPLRADRLPSGRREDIVRSARTATLMQGVAPYGSELIFSQSWGPADSHMSFYDEGEPDYTENTRKGEMTVPPYLEQIVCDGEDLYILFESPAAKYRQNPDITHVDRVLRLSLGRLARMQ